MRSGALDLLMKQVVVGKQNNSLYIETKGMYQKYTVVDTYRKKVIK